MKQMGTMTQLNSKVLVSEIRLRESNVLSLRSLNEKRIVHSMLASGRASGHTKRVPFALVTRRIKRQPANLNSPENGVKPVSV